MFERLFARKRFIRVFVAISLGIQPLYQVGIQKAWATSEDAPVDIDAKNAILDEGTTMADAILGKDNYHRLDPFRLLAQTNYDLTKPHQVDVRAIAVQVIDQNELVLREFNVRSGGEYLAQGPQSVYFRLAYQGRVFFKFNAPVKSVSYIDNNVVFTESNGQHSFIDEVSQKTATVQTVSFIDLKAYRPAVGRTALPVFRIPVETSSYVDAGNFAPNSLAAWKLHPRVLRAYSEAQQSAFNLSVSMADPEKLARMEPALESFQEYFLRSLELRGASLEAEAEGAVGGREMFVKFVADYQNQIHQQRVTRSLTPEEVAANLEQNLQPEVLKKIDEVAGKISANLATQKKLLARFRILWAALSAPQPMGAPKLAQAMALVAASFKGRMGENLAEAMRHMTANPSTQMGLAVATGLALGAAYPQELGAFFYQGLDVTRTVLETVLGGVKNLGHLFVEASKATFTGFNPLHFKEAYLTSEQLPKVGIGLAAIITTLYAAIGLPHLLTNTFYLTKDLRITNWQEAISKEGSLWGAVKVTFIRRQQELQADYLNALARDTVQAVQTIHFTPEEDAEIERVISEIEAKKQKGFISRWLTKTSERSPPRSVSIESFGQALRHFLFSFATFTISGKTYTKIWNTWFAARSFVYSPSVVAAWLIFPNFWSLATQGKLPSDWNGGNRNRVSQMAMWFLDRPNLRALQAWENAFLSVETELSREALKQAYHQSIRHMKNADELKNFYDGGTVIKISDKVLSDLTDEQRTFFRVYYEELLERSTQKYMADIGVTRAILTNSAKDVPGGLAAVTITREQAQALVVESATEDVYNFAAAAASKRWSTDNARRKLVDGMVSFLDAQNNPQVKRIQIAAKQSDKPQAMARAVRAMIASNVVDKPLELMFTFVCMAGITSGLLQPIQDEMFSENSWFHLSKMVFSNGFIYGVISGVLNDVWMKLQMDTKNEGMFENVPTGKDAERSFFRYFFKQFVDKENSLWKNQVHYTKLIWANMRAAFTTFVLVNLVTLGRFDLDSYVVGYLFAYFTPLTGLAMKIEQTFELASGYFSKDIPEHLRSHPRAQEYLNKEVSRKRLWFNLFYKTYENILGYWMLNFQQMKTATFGTRSFSRILLGGYTWTEGVVTGLRKIGELTSSVPGAQRVTDLCQHFLSNNYTDFEKIQPPKK